MKALFYAFTSIMALACASYGDDVAASNGELLAKEEASKETASAEEQQAERSPEIPNCLAMPSCDQGDDVLFSRTLCTGPNCPPESNFACPQGKTCYTREECGKQVACAKSAGIPVCQAMPVCDPGDETLFTFTICTGPNCPPVSNFACPQGKTCYTRERCGKQAACAH